jgi:4'-phosphopantetheinyl transferase
LPEFGHNHVHVWHAFQHESPHRELLEAYGALLSVEEREREARFHFEKDRVRFRVTRAMVRRLLGAYSGLEPSACEFTLNEHGRPSLANPGARDLRFNVSHTQDLILLAVTRGREVGVDVERVQPKRSAELARRFFAPFESQRVLDAPEVERDELFYQYWTLKESYIKARGMGLAIPLRKFGFTLDDAGASLWTDASLGDDASRWWFMRFRPTGAHHAALCVEHRAGEAVHVERRDFASVPLAGARAPA